MQVAVTASVFNASSISLSHSHYLYIVTLSINRQADLHRCSDSAAGGAGPSLAGCRGGCPHPARDHVRGEYIRMRHMYMKLCAEREVQCCVYVCLCACVFSCVYVHVHAPSI